MHFYWFFFFSSISELLSHMKTYNLLFCGYETSFFFFWCVHFHRIYLLIFCYFFPFSFRFHFERISVSVEDTITNCWYSIFVIQSISFSLKCFFRVRVCFLFISVTEDFLSHTITDPLISHELKIDFLCYFFFVFLFSFLLLHRILLSVCFYFHFPFKVKEKNTNKKAFYILLVVQNISLTFTILSSSKT